jgi:hypothetical protein
MLQEQEGIAEGLDKGTDRLSRASFREVEQASSCPLNHFSLEPSVLT